MQGGVKESKQGKGNHPPPERTQSPRPTGIMTAIGWRG